MKLRLPALDPATLTPRTDSGYPEPYRSRVLPRVKRQLGKALGLQQFGVNLTTLPPGKEWLARGTAVYGGGSVIDTAVSIAGDSFYFIPTHEMNAGVALIAYRMQADGRAQESVPPPADKLTEAEWSAVQQRPWDWDTLGMPRLDHVLPALPGTVPGTRQQPLTEEAAQAVAKITDAELDRLVWEACRVRGIAGTADTALVQALTRGVQELIQQSWRPLVFPSGKHPEEAYRFFSDPTETLYTLARAYPHLPSDLQDRAKRLVADWSSADGPLAGPTGRRTLPADVGEVRSAYDVPDRLLRVTDDFGRSDLARLYPRWLWAHVTGDWSKIHGDWPRLRPLADSPPNALQEDCRNGYVAGLIAYCRIAHRVRGL